MPKPDETQAAWMQDEVNNGILCADLLILFMDNKLQAAIKAAKLLPENVIVSRETWSQEIDREEPPDHPRWLAYQSRSDARAQRRLK